MKLKKVRVTNFRCIDDSTEFTLDDVTCLVGKNEAGKSSVLKALYKLNPTDASDKEYDKQSDYPRRYLLDYDERHPQGDADVLNTTWQLEEKEIDNLKKLLGPDSINGTEVTVRKGAMIMNNKRYRIIADQVGTPELIIDAETGWVVEKFHFDEFGVPQENEGHYQIPFGFAGGLYDPDTGLVRFGARDYDPYVGRWTSKDPILFAGGDTNLYGYVLNDPVNWIDPTGMFLSDAQWGAIIGGAIGGAASDAILGTYTFPGIGTTGGAIIGGLFGATLGGTLAPHISNASELPPQLNIQTKEPIMCKP